MKYTKKLVTAISLTAVSAFSFLCISACNQESPPPEEPDRLQLLYGATNSDVFTENVTVTTTDTRTDKYGYYSPKTIKLWTEGDKGKSYLDDTDNPTNPNKIYRVANKDGTVVHVKGCKENVDQQGTEYAFQISDLSDWDLNNYGYGELTYTSAQWIGRCAGFWSHTWLNGCSISAKREGQGWPLGLGSFNEYEYQYTESTNTFVFVNVYYVRYLNEHYEEITPEYHPCTVTIKLDSLNRLSQAICNVENNGVLTSTYEYGNATIDIPQNVLDFMEEHKNDQM